MNQLYSMAYISKNKIPGTREDVKNQIASILESAQRNNPSLNVTGALLYSGGFFCQVIEGPEDNLEELFETIQMDDRHGDVTVLHFHEISERGFSDWSMAFAGIEETMRFDIEGIKKSKDDLALLETGKNLVAVLEELVTQQQSIDSQ
ncbi:MAG TPA: BLUF domain-containing protein [Pseudomonadales bacterium]|nr:BLUF domain-containing protein [Pseudomonadales bacterium]